MHASAGVAKMFAAAGLGVFVLGAWQVVPLWADSVSGSPVGCVADMPGGGIRVLWELC